MWHLHVVLLGHAPVLVGACVLCWCRNWHLMWCSWSRRQIGTCFLSRSLCRDASKAVLLGADVRIYSRSPKFNLRSVASVI